MYRMGRSITNVLSPKTEEQTKRTSYGALFVDDSGPNPTGTNVQDAKDQGAIYAGLVLFLFGDFWGLWGRGLKGAKSPDNLGNALGVNYQPGPLP